MGNADKRKRRAKKVKKEQRIQRQERRKPKAPNRFTVPYDSPDALQAVGPLVRGTWMVPEALARRMAEAGRRVPQPVAGYLLLDTGASATCISVEAASELGLKAVGLGATYGAGGKHQNPVYRARLAIGISDDKGHASTVGGEMQAMGIPDMEKHFSEIKAQSEDGPVRLVGLLGRDFLRHATVVYRGSKGVLEVQLDVDSLLKAVH